MEERRGRTGPAKRNAWERTDRMNSKTPVRTSGPGIAPLRTPMLLRKCTCGGSARGGEKCERCSRKAISQHPSPRSSAATAVPDSVRDALQSSGDPLDTATRAFMEPRFGHDFSRVRVHSDEPAAQSARAVSAQAYTVGQHIFVDRQLYQPNTDAGRQLMAHELAHVVQQRDACLPSPGQLVIGEAGSPYEAEAERAAAHVAGRRDSSPGTLREQGPGGGGRKVNRPTVQRQFNYSLTPTRTVSDILEIGASEDAAAAQSKLQRLAQEFKADSTATISLTSYLSEDAKLSSTKETEERGRITQHMRAIRDALAALGVPSGSISIEPPTGYATSSSGVITAALRGSSTVSRGLPGGPTVPSTVPPAKTTPSPSLSDLLTFKFTAGGVQFTAELPKSVTAKLPVALSAAKTLSFELKAESSLDFSFSVTLDGLPHLKVVAQAGVSYDKDKQTTTGKASIELQATRTVCNASDPESLKTKIKTSGDKLKTAMDQLGAAKPDERLGKLADIASAIADMYDSVDKAKSACKQVPAATISFGVQGPLTPETDPTKRTPSSIGVTLTVPF